MARGYLGKASIRRGDALFAVAPCHNTVLRLNTRVDNI